VLSQNAGIGWYPKLPLNVGAAASFSLGQTTIEESRSITSTGNSRPATRAGGNGRPVDLAVLGPHHFPRPGPGGGHRGQPGRFESIKQPPARRVGSPRPKQSLLISEYRDIGNRGGTIGHRDRQIDQHPARIVPRPQTAQPGRGLRQLTGQRCSIRDISQQASTDVLKIPG
jgi:hypothetical protein